jgi:hypothetical protein
VCVASAIRRSASANPFLLDSGMNTLMHRPRRY